MLLRDLSRVLFSGSVFILLFLTMWRFVRFLSSHDYLSPSQSPPDASNTLFAIFKDSLLLAVFVFQHAFMASLSKSRRGNILWRSFYVAATCLALQLMMRSWSSTHNLLIWKLDSSGIVHWIFTLTHCISWMVIYGGTLLMDFAELIGSKKVYYMLFGLGDPMHQKSEELQRLFAHMRHPCFTGLNVILWMHPIMSLDRLLLALGLTITMIVCFNVDNGDYLYQKEQCARKITELENTRHNQFDRM